MKLSLPSTELRDAVWQDLPPDPLDDPDLYDGIMWRRVGAFCVDVVAVSILSFVAWFLLGLMAVMSFGLLLPLQVAAVALLPTAYHTYFIGSSGATPGMRFFDVEIRTWTGRRPDYVQAFLQTVLFYTTVSLTTGLVLLVALFNDRHRTLHDLMAGTVGVRHSHIIAPQQLIEPA